MESKIEKHPTPHIAHDVETQGKSSIDADALKLAEMGYTQDMARKYTVWSVLGVGFSITNSWFGISAALITGINSGGPLLVIYGIMLIALISTCVGISLSELASAMPNAGGQYFWAGELAPRRFTRLASYMTGWLAWWGAMFTMSFNPGMSSWQAYQLSNIFCFFFNCYGKILPTVGKTTLWISLLSFAVILITVPAVAPTHQHARFVFATFINNTGWQQDGIAFIVGLVNTNWAFACLDCATHLAEEVHRPEKMVPIAIMGTVGIGFVTSWFFSVGIFFSIVGDFAEIGASDTGVPILEIFFRALQIILGRVDYAGVSRAIGGFLLIAGWPRMITACIVLLYLSYSVPVICLLIRGRDKISHGPFWLGPVGLFANIVLLVWTLFTLVMYSFPYAKPVEAGNMNYVCVVYAIVALIASVDWLFRGRKKFVVAGERKEEGVNPAPRVVDLPGY
ncbi:unnamed protein product [Alternaria alternata]